MKYLLIFALFLVYSCASSYRASESVEDKISRFKSKETQVNKLPDFKSLNIASLPKSRNVAAIGPSTSRLKELSNKRVYFLAVLHQYRDFQQYLDQKIPAINSCSHFHTTHLNHGKNFKRTPEGNPWRHSVLAQELRKVDVGEFPELFLALDPVETTPQVKDLIVESSPKERTKMVFDAFKIHVQKTYKEIIDLCETGLSSNYYLYENFVTHTKNNPEFKNSEKAIKSLLKLSIFSNIFLIKSIQGMLVGKRQPVGPAYSSFEEEIFERVGAKWSKPYWDSVKDQRQKIESSLAKN